MSQTALGLDAVVDVECQEGEDQQRHYQDAPHALPRHVCLLFRYHALLLLRVVDGGELGGIVALAGDQHAVEHVAELQSHSQRTVNPSGTHVGFVFRQQVGADVVQCRFQPALLHQLVQVCEVVGSLAHAAGLHQVGGKPYQSLVALAEVAIGQFRVNPGGLALLPHALQDQHAVQGHAAPVLLHQLPAVFRDVLQPHRH